MGILDKLLGRKKDNESHEMYGFKIVDRRSEEEKRIEKHAKSSLDGKYEEMAERLYNLLGMYKFDEEFRISIERGGYGMGYGYGSKQPGKAETEIKQIGENLFSEGGHELMTLVAYRVAALGSDADLLSMCWDGIGGWQW